MGRKTVPEKTRACWLCGTRALEAQRVCWQCGAELSPEMYAANARREDEHYGDDSYLPAPKTPVRDRRDSRPAWVNAVPSRDLRSALPPIVSAVVNVIFAAGFGVLGALIGGGVWFLVTTTVHIELGFFAILMGFLIGWGVVLGSTMRGGPPALLAMAITFAAYAFWAMLINAQGVPFNLVDIPSLLITFVVAAVPPYTRVQHEA